MNNTEILTQFQPIYNPHDYV